MFMTLKGLNRRLYPDQKGGGLQLSTHTGELADSG